LDEPIFSYVGNGSNNKINVQTVTEEKEKLKFKEYISHLSDKSKAKLSKVMTNED